MEKQNNIHETLVQSLQTDHTQILTARDLTISSQTTELNTLQQKLRERDSTISSRELKLSKADSKRTDALDKLEKQLTKKLVAVTNAKEGEVSKLQLKLEVVEKERDSAIRHSQASQDQNVRCILCKDVTILTLSVQSDQTSKSELENMKRRSETITSERDAAIRAKLALEKQKVCAHLLQSTSISQAVPRHN